MKKLTIAVILALLISVCCAVAKDKKHDDAAPADASLKLSPEEAKDATILAQNSQILELQIEKLQNQVSQARQKASADLREFTDKTAKAHGLEPEKYRLDIAAKQFVAIAPAAEKK